MVAIDSACHVLFVYKLRITFCGLCAHLESLHLYGPPPPQKKIIVWCLVYAAASLMSATSCHFSANDNSILILIFLNTHVTSMVSTCYVGHIVEMITLTVERVWSIKALIAKDVVMCLYVCIFIWCHQGWYMNHVQGTSYIRADI